MHPKRNFFGFFVILFLAVPLVVGLVGCGTLDLIGHARIHNDLLYTSGSRIPDLDEKSAEVVEVDGQAAQTAPFPSLDDSGPHPAAWVSSGSHLFKIKVTPARHRTGVSSPIEYVTFSATVRSGTSYLLFVVNDKPLLFEQRKGPGFISLPPFNEPIPVTVVAEGAATGSGR